MIGTSQDVANDHMPEKIEHRQEYLQTPAQIGEERHRLGLLQTNLKKSDSVFPDDKKKVQKKVQEKETSSWLSSTHVCRSHHWTIDCDACVSGIPPVAAVHLTRQEQQREQQAKRQLQQESQSKYKW